MSSGVNNFVGAWQQAPFSTLDSGASARDQFARRRNEELYQRPYVLQPAEPDFNKYGQFRETVQTCMNQNMIGWNNPEGVRDCVLSARFGPAWYL